MAQVDDILDQRMLLGQDSLVGGHFLGRVGNQIYLEIEVVVEVQLLTLNNQID